MNSDLQSLKTQISETRRNRRGYRVFSKELRSAIVAYGERRCSAGATLESVAKSLDIDSQQLGRWRDATRRKATPIRRVAIVRETSMLCVHGPMGLRIEGNVTQIAELLRACSGS